MREFANLALLDASPVEIRMNARNVCLRIQTVYAIPVVKIAFNFMEFAYLALNLANHAQDRVNLSAQPVLRDTL